MQYSNRKGFVCFKIDNIPTKGGVKAEYFNQQHQRWFPISIAPQGAEIFAASDNQDWNRATSFEGTIMDSMILDSEIYWNYFIDFKGTIPTEKIKVRITVFAASGMDAKTEEIEVLIDPKDAVFINDFENFYGAEITQLAWDEERAILQENTRGVEIDTKGWVIDYVRGEVPCLSNYGMQEDPPLYFKPELEGKYEVYLVFRNNRLECNFKFPRLKHLEHVLIDEQMIPAYKWWKEVPLGTFQFEKNDEIAIKKAEAQLRNKLHIFGELAYIKLLPAEKKIKKNFHKTKEIVFYAEPSSHAYYGELINEQDAVSFVEEHVSLGIDTINCQMLRIGGEPCYPSKVAPLAREGASRGDDCQLSTGRDELRRNLNLFELLPKLCHERGLKFIANAGINVCYTGSPLESKFSAENPDLHHPYFGMHFFDYTLNEVREFAADCLAEMASYDIDGLSIDHMRYLYGQNLETIVAFHRLAREKIGYEKYSKLEVNVRIPVDNPEYYQALQILMEEDLISTVTPSRQSSLYPIMDISNYVKLADKYGKKVHGCLDGWIKRQALIAPLPRPEDYRKAGQHYLNQGATALFFYQSSQILRNPYLRNFIRSLN